MGEEEKRPREGQDTDIGEFRLSIGLFVDALLQADVGLDMEIHSIHPSAILRGLVLAGLQSVLGVLLQVDGDLLQEGGTALDHIQSALRLLLDQVQLMDEVWRKGMIDVHLRKCFTHR